MAPESLYQTVSQDMLLAIKLITTISIIVALRSPLLLFDLQDMAYCHQFNRVLKVKDSALILTRFQSFD